MMTTVLRTTCVQKGGFLAPFLLLVTLTPRERTERTGQFALLSDTQPER